jgi:hypothetical protein
MFVNAQREAPEPSPWTQKPKQGENCYRVILLNVDIKSTQSCLSGKP